MRNKDKPLAVIQAARRPANGAGNFLLARLSSGARLAPSGVLLRPKVVLIRAGNPISLANRTFD